MKKEELKKVVEALLFLSSREWSPAQLSKLLRHKEEKVKEVLEELKQEYASRESALEVRVLAGKYALSIREDTARVLRKYYREAELSRKELEVLGYIAKNKGILKSKLAKILGPEVYPAVKALVEKGFVQEVKVGRTSRLTVTEKFKDYFEIR